MLNIAISQNIQKYGFSKIFFLLKEITFIQKWRTKLIKCDINYILYIKG